MTLLLDAGQIAARRVIAGGPLAPLADSLRAELQPLLDHPPEIPREKAMLSRAGGRCAHDGGRLDFDPWSPQSHRCPVCARVHTGEAHYRWWIMSFQLWLAERCVHGAALALLHDDDACADFAATVLDQYCELYLSYPNEDNVLGPTRLFFSTYLESIWLLQICLTLDLLDARAPDPARRTRVLDRIVAPSAEIIASYDEGLSNRQTWNDVALFAASTLLHRPADAEAAIVGRSGIIAHLAHGMLADGTWYEGENYHLFAHRALWYGVTMAERGGVEIPVPLLKRFDLGFETPFLAMLPDWTLPSRRDSQYAISVRQPRFAELAELGLARTRNETMSSVLGALYASDVPRRETGRALSTADVERNLEATSLSRADLGWRSLLWARAELPPAVPLALRSVLLDGQGIAVFRRNDGRTYAALDYGHRGGGHGHPDRLNMLLAHGHTRWLDDVGTGSYVDPTLHWYRSTLAHNAPLVDGRSQRVTDGELLAYDERGLAGWVEARAEISNGVTVKRALVVSPEFTIDRMEWSADQVHRVELPLHVSGELMDATWQPASIDGGSEPTDGFGFLRSMNRAVLPEPRHAFWIAAVAGDRTADVWLLSTTPVEWFRAVAPGAPGQDDRSFFLVRANGQRGSMAIVWSLGSQVTEVSGTPDDISVRRADGALEQHHRDEAGWHIQLTTGSARSSIDLGGRVGARRSLDGERAGSMSSGGEHAGNLQMGGDPHAQNARPAITLTRVTSATPPAPDHLSLDETSKALSPAIFVRLLAESEYRRSESTWRGAGAPRALVGITVFGDDLIIECRVEKRDVTFASRRDASDLDNEHPDTNSDGLQLYVVAGDKSGAWLLVPEDSGSVRVTPIAGPPPSMVLGASWRMLADGYTVRVRIPMAQLASPDLRIGLVVNEIAPPPHRRRRRGQLVLGDKSGEYVYLRGDRESPETFLRFRLPE